MDVEVLDATKWRRSLMMGLVMDRIPDMSLPLRWGYDILVVSDKIGLRL